MTNPIDLLTKTELKTELGAAMLELAEKDAEIARLREANRSAYRAILLADWNAIADELQNALGKG